MSEQEKEEVKFSPRTWFLLEMNYLLGVNSDAKRYSSMFILNS